MEGPEPANVDSDGFLPQENMSAPGIFHPLLQPVLEIVQIIKPENAI